MRDGIFRVLETSGIYKSGILDSLGLSPRDLINFNIGANDYLRVEKCLEKGRISPSFSDPLNLSLVFPEFIPENCEDYLTLITKRPIYSVYPENGLTLIYGGTLRPASIISTASFLQELTDEKQIYLGIKALTSHEFGHLLGNLPFSKEKDSSGNPRNTLNSFGLHCAKSSCLMSQGYSPQEFVDKGIYVESNPIFCLDCTRGLINSLRELPSTQWQDFLSG